MAKLTEAQTQALVESGKAIINSKVDELGIIGAYQWHELNKKTVYSTITGKMAAQLHINKLKIDFDHQQRLAALKAL